MVAYSFQTQFADPIITGRKMQTIRAHRKRHARPGEPLQLFVGMRTKHCRKLIEPDPLCVAVIHLKLDVRDIHPLLWWTPEVDQWVKADDLFAQADGFETVEAMRRFWFQTHGPGIFEGVLIKWRKAE